MCVCCLPNCEEVLSADDEDFSVYYNASAAYLLLSQLRKKLTLSRKSTANLKNFNI